MTDSYVSYISRKGRIISATCTTAGKTEFYRDAVGSVVMTTNYNSPIGKSQRFAAYGKELTPNSYYSNYRMGWVGSLGYRETNLDHAEQYIRARHYSPTEARWTTSDVLRTSKSPYDYASGNPALLTDFTGRKPSVGNGNVGPCAIYVCEEHTFQGIFGIFNPIVASHKFVCVTGPYGGCTGGLYPSGSNYGSPGSIGNLLDHCPVDTSDSSTVCTQVSSDGLTDNCALAAAVCGCVRLSIKHPGPYSPIRDRDCYTYPYEMMDCACSLLYPNDPLGYLDCRGQAGHPLDPFMPQNNI